MADDTPDRDRCGRAWHASGMIGWLLWAPLEVASWRWPTFEIFASLAQFAFTVSIFIWLATVVYWALGSEPRWRHHG